MARTKAETALQNFNNEVAALAISKVDKESLAQDLAKQLTSQIKMDAKYVLTRQLSIKKMIEEILTSENTKVGRNYQGLISEITQDMIDAIRVKKE